MPSTITHDYHFKDMYSYSSKYFKQIYSQETYNNHSLYAQGHDALFFYNFWELHKLSEKKEQVIYLQDHAFQSFCTNYINLIKENNLQDFQSLKLLLYGYISHHILDSFVHPYIIYETELTGSHALVESYLDLYMLQQREEQTSKCKIHQLISPVQKMSPEAIFVVNDAFSKTYGYKDLGHKYLRALNQVNIFLRLLRYDPTGIKDFGYKLIDKLNLIDTKFSFLSYYHNYSGFSQYLNEEHNIWYNPSSIEPIESNQSFLELYELATKQAAEIISALEEAINEKAKPNEIKNIIPNVSAIHGLQCDMNLSFKILKKINNTKIRKI